MASLRLDSIFSCANQQNWKTKIDLESTHSKLCGNIYIYSHPQSLWRSKNQDLKWNCISIFYNQDSFEFQRRSSSSGRQPTKERHQCMRLTYPVKPSKMPRRAETNIEQNESWTEAENFQATVQTMLDRLGEKHPSSATPQIISPLKTRQSDEKTVSYS